MSKKTTSRKTVGGDVDGDPMPAHVEREFHHCLDFGIVAHCIAHARCGHCGHDFVIAIACTCRGV